jgi:LemA protein
MRDTGSNMQTIEGNRSKSMKGLWIGLGVVGLFVLVLLFGAGSYVSATNQMVQLNEDVNKAYSTVDVEQQRRLDLIPNLVASVKGYVKRPC